MTRNLLILRAIVSAHSLFVLLQVALAVFAANGAALPIPHSGNAHGVLTLGVVQAIAAFLLPWPKGGVWWRIFAVVIAACEALQLVTGIAYGLVFHVTIAMVIWSLAAALQVGVFARAPQPAPQALPQAA
jgi:hypothetical protein